MSRIARKVAYRLKHPVLNGQCAGHWTFNGSREPRRPPRPTSFEPIRTFHASSLSKVSNKNTPLYDDLTTTPELELATDFQSHPISLGPPELLSPPKLRSSIRMGNKAELRPIAGQIGSGLEYGMVWTEPVKTILVLKKPNDIGTERALIEIMRCVGDELENPELGG